MLILSESDLRSVLTMRDVIEAVEQGFHALADGRVILPERLKFTIPDRKAVMLEMPSYLSGAQSALGTKIVSVFEGNPALGLDSIQGLYLLLDSETGIPLALMDGRFITAIRTAATSAVATKFMATAGQKRLAIFGAGVQAKFHIEAMLEVADIERVTITSRTRDHAATLADTVRSTHKLPCDVVSAEEAVSPANLICTCTTSPTPLFDGRLLKPGTHINAVGAFTPSTRELDTDAVCRSRVIIDSELAAGREAGEILIPISEGVIDVSHVKGTLADLVSGRAGGRESAEEITIFRSCGLAIEDLVTAKLAYKRAISRRISVQVPI